MAADPNAVPIQPFNLGYQSSFEPLRLNPPIQLQPADWSQVGKAAMQASDMLQKSAMNPAVAAQMRSQMKGAQEGIAQFNWADSLPNNMGRLLYRTDPETGRAYLISPAETGKFAPLFQPKVPPPPGTKKQPPAPKTGPGTGKELQEETKKETQPSQQPKDENDIRIDTASADTDTSGLSASTDDDFAMGRMMQQRGSAAAQQGTPSSLTFLNPATGNVEPRMFTAPSPGMFAARAPAPPAAPNMLLTGSQPPPSTPGSAISQVTQQPGVALANWQETNIHPVVAPKQVLDAVKTNVTTQAQDATYLPNGGVNGEPAWAIHMKGGGQTMISASQLAASPWGKALMAGHNASEVMEAQQQQPPQTNEPGNMLLQGQVPGFQPQPGQQPGQPPTPMPSGTGVGAAQGSPIAPPAPTGQPPTPMPSGTGMGAPQGPPAAPSPHAYNAAAYQMPQGPTITQTGEVNPALMAGGTNEQALAAAKPPPARTELTPLSDEDKAVVTPEAIAAARANAKPDPSQPADDGNPYMGELGPWHLYRDDKNRTNELYAVRQGLSSLFKQQRYILGSDGWQEYELPDTNMRMNVEGEFLGGGKGGVVGAPIPDGKTINNSKTFPSFSHDAIVKMSVPQMQQLLELAGKYHNTTGEANSAVVGRLSDLVDSSQRVQRMIDGNTVALNSGKDPAEYNRNAQFQSSEARQRNAIMLPGQTLDQLYGKFPFSAKDFPHGPAEWQTNPLIAWHDMRAGGTDPNKFSDYLEEQVRRMNDSMKETPGRQVAIVPTEQEKTGPSVTVYGPWGIGGTLKAGSDTASNSPHMEIQKQFEARSPDDQREAIKGLQNVKYEYDKQFKETYEDAFAHNFRLPPQATLYYHSITDDKGQLREGGKFPDKDNRFRDANGQLVNPFGPRSGSTAPETVKPEEAQSAPHIKTTADLDAVKGGNLFWDIDGKLKRKPKD